MVILGDQYVFWLDISMHEMVLMEIFDSLADISEVALHKLLVELSVPVFDLLVEAASRGELQYHIGGVLVFLVVVIDEFDDVGVVELVMHVDLLFGVLVVDLSIIICTILIATTSLFYVLRASLT